MISKMMPKFLFLVFCWLVISKAKLHGSGKGDKTSNYADDNPDKHAKDERKLLLHICDADCVNDSDCYGDLVCYQRNKGDPTPCCDGYSLESKTNYCALPYCGIWYHTLAPSPRPTRIPTISPTIQSITDDGTGSSITIASSACFPGRATVQVEGKGPVAMKNLHVGNRILTGKATYEPIYAFGHQNQEKIEVFIQLFTKGGVLEVTADHMLYKNAMPHPVRADSVNVGDVLAGNNEQVSKIAKVQRNGIYAPLTTGGTLVVDGVIVSSYVSFQEGASAYIKLRNGAVTSLSQHDYAHVGLSPLRLACRVVSSSFCVDYTDDGMPSYVNVAVKLNLWIHQQNIFVQASVLLTVMALAGACFAMERIFSESMAPLAFALLCGTVAWMNWNRITVRANKAISG